MTLNLGTPEPDPQGAFQWHILSLIAQLKTVL